MTDSLRRRVLARDRAAAAQKGKIRTCGAYLLDPSRPGSASCEVTLKPNSGTQLSRRPFSLPGAAAARWGSGLVDSAGIAAFAQEPVQLFAPNAPACLATKASPTEFFRSQPAPDGLDVHLELFGDLLDRHLGLSHNHNGISVAALSAESIYISLCVAMSCTI